MKWLWNKLFILNRARLVTVLVVQQFLDLFTTWWLIFYAKVGEEVNPFLQVVNGENGLAWLISLKLFAATLGATVCWMSLSPSNAKRWIWGAWNALAYAYTALILWNSYLVLSTLLANAVV